MCFEAGDIITGTENSNIEYGVTNTEMLKGKVVRVYKGVFGKEMEIKVLDHVKKSKIGISYYVEASRDLFKHVRPRNNIRKIE